MQVKFKDQFRLISLVEEKNNKNKKENKLHNNKIN